MISYLPMSSGMKCVKCNKGKMYGHKMSHAKNRTNRTFDPNLHSMRIMIDGAMKKVRLCAKCLRMAKRSVNKTVSKKPAMVSAA
jgi:large subunit ribosomal protein L28